MILRYPYHRSRGTLAQQFAVATYRSDAFAEAKSRMMVELIDHLELRVSGPSVFAMRILEELILRFEARDDWSTRIRIWIDANDLRLGEDGLPDYHYRINYSVPGSELSIDRRSSQFELVGSFVMDAISQHG